MPYRKRLIDVMTTRAGPSVGFCNGDVARIASVVNEAQERLLFAGGETGWYGSWWKMAFNLTQDDPYITAPREVARLINMDVCNKPIRIQNEFYEFLEAGIGLQPVSASCQGQRCPVMEAYERGTVISQLTFTPGRKLRIRAPDPADVGRTVIVQGEDNNGAILYGQNGTDQILGIVLDLTTPFVDTPTTLEDWTGFQKDQTIGPVSVYELDPDTGNERLIATYAPNETVPLFRRYLVNGLPQWCCEPSDGNPIPQPVQVTAMAKMEFIPVQVPEDYLLIQNIPAIIEEVQAVRYDGIDGEADKKMSEYHHARAIRYLNGQLEHYYGKLRPATVFSPFGDARLSRQGIGQMM